MDIRTVCTLITVLFCKTVAISCNSTEEVQHHGCCSVHFSPKETKTSVIVNINATSDFKIFIVDPSDLEIECGEPSYTEVRIHSEYGW